MQTAESAATRQPAGGIVRAAAVLYLVVVVTSIFGLVASQSLIVPHDANATAHNIRSSETLFRLALVSSVIATIAFVFLGRELYRLLKDVNHARASLMVVLVLLSVPISFVSGLTDVAALRLIDGPAVSGLATNQMNGLAMFFLGLSSDTSALNSIFFGLWLFPFGLLVIRSGFIPRMVGYLVIIAGCSYLAGSLNFLLSPPFAPLVSGIATVGYLGEFAAIVWLVYKAAQVQFGGARSMIGNPTNGDSKLEGGHAW
jgi:uncharacterized protein DUF4386